MSTLLQDDGTGRIHEQLAELARWTEEDAGRVLVTFTPNPPWIMTLPGVVISLLILVLGLPANTGFVPVEVVFMALIFGGISLAAWRSMRSHKTRVAERALIVGKHRQVIPFATIDPGRVAVSSRLRYLGVHFHSGGLRIVQSQGSAAIVNGLNPQPDAANRHAPPSSVPSPFCEWGLSGEPVAVLRALESAMVDGGFPAHGMTERARAHTFTPTVKHPPQDFLVLRRALDPPIGVGGPVGPVGH